MAKDKTRKAKGGTSPSGNESLGLQWLNDVAAHDFDAASAYLSLKLERNRRWLPSDAFARLRLPVAGPTTSCALATLWHCLWTTPGVRRDLLNAVSGKRLSPVLVVSTGDGGDIADGYHRVSLAYHLDPFGDVPLRIGAAPA
jgi:hypothetical protein